MNLATPRSMTKHRPCLAPLARDEGREDFAFLLLDGFMMMALASAIEALRLANHVLARQVYGWRLVSVDGQAVINSAGLPTPVHARAEPLSRGERLVVVGGSQHDLRSGFPKPLLTLLRRTHAHGTQMIGLCTGAVALVEAGLLPAAACAVHWEYSQPLSERGDDFASRPPAFTLGAIPTAAGGVAAADLFLHLISARLGSQVAAGVADSLLLTSIRDVGEAQTASALAHAGARTPALRQAIAAMEAAGEEVLPIQTIAAQAGVSVRQLERLFDQHFHTSPHRYYVELRMQRARRLLTMTDLSVSEIACATGFGTTSQLSRRFKDRFGHSPYQHRLMRDPRDFSTTEDRAYRRPTPIQHGDLPC